MFRQDQYYNISNVISFRISKGLSLIFHGHFYIWIENSRKQDLTDKPYGLVVYYIPSLIS